MPALRPGPFFGMPPALAKYRSPVAYTLTPPADGDIEYISAHGYGYGSAGGVLASVQALTGTLTGLGDSDAILHGYAKSLAITGARVILYSDSDPGVFVLLGPFDSGVFDPGVFGI